MAPRKIAGIVAVVALVALAALAGWLGLGLALAFFSGPFGGERTIDDPSDCRTSLAKTTTCHGEDRSFQECYYHFHAEGVPDAEVCAAFLGKDSMPASSGDGGEACEETSPRGWQSLPCQQFHLDPEMACFYCKVPRHERSRQIVQAYDRSCRRGVVLKSCNAPLVP